MTACQGCTARAVARSLAAFHALHANGDGDKQPLRDLVARLALPAEGQAAMKAAVMGWWWHDREQQGVSA